MLRLYVVFLCLWYGLTASEDICLFEPEALKFPLQVAFVIDQTVVSAERSEWTLFQNETMYYLMPALEKEFHGTEFAVTSFSDWPDPYELIKNSTEDVKDCYTTVSQFTRDQSEIMKKVGEIKQFQNQFSTGGGGSYFALMSTAADLQLGWKAMSEIRNIVVLFTDTYPNTHTPSWNHDIDFGTRKVPKGDGTDSCSESLPPPNPLDNRYFERALVKRELLVVGVFLRTDDDSVNLYDNDLEQLYFPYIRFTIPNEKHHATSELVRSFDYKTLAKSIAKQIVEELRICTYSDPPAYNTLGL